MKLLATAVAESSATKMGQFDQLIAQELMRNRSQRGDDPNQRARDFAARQMNARDGGPSSTAWPSEQAASRGGPAVGGGGAAGGGEIQQKQVPIPMARPMDAAIDELKRVSEREEAAAAKPKNEEKKDDDDENQPPTTGKTKVKVKLD